jgi:hypothetical protein
MGIMLKEEWDAFPKFEPLRCPTCGEYYWWPYGSKCDVCDVKLKRLSRKMRLKDRICHSIKRVLGRLALCRPILINEEALIRDWENEYDDWWDEEENTKE